MDPISDVFRTLRVRSALYFRTQLTAPWGLEVPAQPRVARFHIVVDGSCLIGLEGREVELQRGDLAIVPKGAAHTLRSDAQSGFQPLSEVLEETAYDGSNDLRHGGGGSAAVLVCGHFGFDDDIAHPVVESLPPLLHISAKQGHDFSWLDAATRALGAETAQRLPGWEVIVSRVSEMLFIQVLRIQLSSEDAPTAIAAFSDDRLSHALQAIHESPEEEWDLETLSKKAGMSRTAFAVRFREHLGMPPMAYLTQWRLQKARAALLSSEEIVAAIAAQHGYRSEAAFSRAFHRLYGMPPAAYRKEHHG